MNWIGLEGWQASGAGQVACGMHACMHVAMRAATLCCWAS